MRPRPSSVHAPRGQDDPLSGSSRKEGARPGVVETDRHTGVQLRAGVHAAVAGLHVHHEVAAPPRVGSRERRVLELLAAGLTTCEIGDRIGYAERTVKKLVTTLISEFGARNRAQLVANAIREGVI